MIEMTITWKRLVNERGQTCERCSCTGDATEAAFYKLKRCLGEVGINVQLVKERIDQLAFSLNPIESNTILIDGKPLEQWVEGTTGKSKCCGPCGDEECRTIAVDGKTYEAIPESMILRAGFLAAAEKLRSL